MEHTLRRSVRSVRVVEDCLNGRRTVWDDAFKPGRNGLVGLEQRIEVNSPIDLVILMLGTNDFQVMHIADAWQSAQGTAALIDAIRRAPIESELLVPATLVVAPPKIQPPRGAIAAKFHGAKFHDTETKAVGLADAIRQVAHDKECHFFDTATITETSRVDRVHLDQHQHQAHGTAIAACVESLLG